MSASVVVLGNGSLARSICYSLALSDIPMVVTVVARDARKSAEIAYVANARAALSGTRVELRAVGADLSDLAALTAVLRAAGPSVVLLVASLQSPWERFTAPSGWTALLDRAGFGLTAPLHARLARIAAAAAADTSARFLNGAYPDAVNPMLAGLGLAPFAGIGNAALISASLRSALAPPAGACLRVLAHHVHLHIPNSPANEARAWLDDTPVIEITDGLVAQRTAARPELNVVTGHSTAKLIADLVAGIEVRASLPGPLGLPGGYPVRIGNSLRLDLPAGLNQADAVAWNHEMAILDGVDVDGTTVRFAERVTVALEPYLSTLDVFGIEELDEVTNALLRLRDTLRAEGPPRVAPRNG